MQFLKANDLTGAYLSETGFKANLKLFHLGDKNPEIIYNENTTQLIEKGLFSETKHISTSKLPRFY